MPHRMLDSIAAPRSPGRRRALQTLGSAGLVVATLPLASLRAAAAAQATYFTWGGYDIPELFGPYAAKNGEPPNFTTYGDGEEGLTKMRAGFVVDVAHPCNQAVPRWRDAGLFQAIDTSRLQHFADLFPRLTGLEGARDADGKQWFVPMEWGMTSITYRTDLVDWQGKPESWSLLWDERYKGRIGVIGSAGDAWWCAAILAGVDFSKISDDDVSRVNELLKKQRPLVRMYTNDLTSMEQALASGELVAAMTWNESPVNLKRQGVPIAYAKPAEGALTWCCGMMLHKDTPEPDKAYDIIDSLTAPETGKYIIEEFGYGHSNRKTFEQVTADRLAEMGLTSDPGDLLDAGKFQIPLGPDLQTRIDREFEEIMAGF